MCPHMRENIGGISVKGRRGVATFYAFIQLLIFISRNASTHPTVSLRDIQGKGHIPLGKREQCRRETVEIPLYEPGNGWLPVGKRVRQGTE